LTKFKLFKAENAPNLSYSNVELNKFLGADPNSWERIKEEGKEGRKKSG
jgi:hypothetical protein